MYVNIIMYFKIMSKVVKHTCRLRKIYTHDQLNTIDISISFLKNFLRGGGAQNLTLPRAPVTLATPLLFYIVP